MACSLNVFEYHAKVSDRSNFHIGLILLQFEYSKLLPVSMFHRGHQTRRRWKKICEFRGEIRYRAAVDDSVKVPSVRLQLAICEMCRNWVRIPDVRQHLPSDDRFEGAVLLDPRFAHSHRLLIGWGRRDGAVNADQLGHKRRDVAAFHADEQHVVARQNLCERQLTPDDLRGALVRGLRRRNGPIVEIRSGYDVLLCRGIFRVEERLIKAQI